MQTVLNSLLPQSLVRDFKRGVACVVGAGLLLSLGCRNNDPEPGDGAGRLPFPGLEMTVSVPEGSGLEARWDLTAEEWSAATGADCRVESGTGSTGEHAALRVQPLPQLPDLIGGPRPPAPIPDELWGEDALATSDLFRGLRQVLSASDQPIGIPVAAPTPVLLVRRDLLDAAGLAPPETWDEYQRLIEQLPQWAPELTAVEPWGPDSRVITFLARAASLTRHPAHYSHLIDIADARPLIAHAGFSTALADAVATIEQMPESVLEYGPQDCLEAMLANRAALAMYWQTVGSIPELRRELPNNAVIEAVPLPGTGRVYNFETEAWDEQTAVHRVSIVGFDGLCGVSSHPDEAVRAAAWDFWVFLTAPGTDQAFPPPLRTLCRTSQAVRPQDWAPAGLSGQGAESFISSIAGSLNGQFVIYDLPLPQRDQFAAELVVGITAAVAGKDPQTALVDVANEWSGLIDQIGRERVIRTVRALSGLQLTGQY